MAQEEPAPKKKDGRGGAPSWTCRALVAGKPCGHKTNCKAYECQNGHAASIFAILEICNIGNIGHLQYWKYRKIAILEICNIGNAGKCGALKFGREQWSHRMESEPLKFLADVRELVATRFPSFENKDFKALVACKLDLQYWKFAILEIEEICNIGNIENFAILEMSEILQYWKCRKFAIFEILENLQY